jgi:hypothetical protein
MTRVNKDEFSSDEELVKLIDLSPKGKFHYFISKFLKYLKHEATLMSKPSLKVLKIISLEKYFTLTRPGVLPV